MLRDISDIHFLQILIAAFQTICIDLRGVCITKTSCSRPIGHLANFDLRSICSITLFLFSFIAPSGRLDRSWWVRWPTQLRDPSRRSPARWRPVGSRRICRPTLLRHAAVPPPGCWLLDHAPQAITAPVATQIPVPTGQAAQTAKAGFSNP